MDFFYCLFGLLGLCALLDEAPAVKERKPLGMPVIAAVVPLMADVAGIRQAFFWGGLVCLLFWGTTLFFKITQRLFPQQVLKWAFMAWVICLAHAGTYLGGGGFLWAVSLTVLLFSQFTKAGTYECSCSEAIVQGAFFWLVVLGLGFCIVFSMDVLGMRTFQTAAGFFLVLGVVAWGARYFELKRGAHV